MSQKILNSILAVITVFFIGLFVNNNIMAQNMNDYKKDMLVTKKGNLPYRVLLPKNYNPNIKYPLILFLHGSGERGNDNNLQLTHGADLFLKESVRREYPAVVVFPQLANDHLWSSLEMDDDSEKRNFIYPEKPGKVMHQELLKSLLKKLKKEFSLDNKRFYVGGLSLGGMGTFEIIYNNPKTFAAAFPICGGANPEIAERISGPSWWIFHGADDDVVPAKYSEQMAEALKKIGADVKLTVYPDVKHDSWTNTFAEPKLLEWLFSKSL